MFREVAIVTFTAGMIGTSAATLANGFEERDAAPTPAPAIERPVTPEPATQVPRKKQRDPDLVAFKSPS